MKNKKKQQGFTLVELLIVIVIIGILAAVIVPTVAGNIEKAKISSDVQDAKNMTTVLQSYCLSNGIDMTKLEAPEVRAIVSSGDKNYTFSPKGSKSTFWYNKSESKIEVAQGELISDTTSSKVNSVYADYVPGSIEELVDGYLYLNTTDKTGVANLLFQLRNLGSSNSYSSLLEVASAKITGDLKTQVKNVFTTFNPDNTLFVGSNSFVTSASWSVERVVFASDLKVISAPAEDVIVRIGTKTETDGIASVTPSSFRIPATVEVIMPGAFRNVQSASKIELAKPATKVLSGALSDSIKSASSVSETAINNDRIKAGNRLITVTIGSTEKTSEQPAVDNTTTFGYQSGPDSASGIVEYGENKKYFEEANANGIFRSTIDTTSTQAGTNAVKVNTKAFLTAFPNVNSLTVIRTNRVDTDKNRVFQIHVMAFDNSGMVLNLLIVVKENVTTNP